MKTLDKITTNIDNETNVNEELIDELVAQGYRVKQQGCKLKIKLEGLSNPIFIVHDLSRNQFIVNTRDTINAISLAAILFIALTNEPDWKLALLLSMMVIGLLSLILTEIKSQPLKKIVNIVNRKVFAQNQHSN